MVAARRDRADGAEQLAVDHHRARCVRRSVRAGDVGSRGPRTRTRRSRGRVERRVARRPEEERLVVRQEDGAAELEAERVVERNRHVAVVHPRVRGRDVALRMDPEGIDREDAVVGQLHPARLVLVAAPEQVARVRPRVRRRVVEERGRARVREDGHREDAAVGQDLAVAVVEVVTPRVPERRRRSHERPAVRLRVISPRTVRPTCIAAGDEHAAVPHHFSGEVEAGAGRRRCGSDPRAVHVAPGVVGDQAVPRRR